MTIDIDYSKLNHLQEVTFKDTVKASVPDSVKGVLFYYEPESQWYIFHNEEKYSGSSPYNYTEKRLGNSGDILKLTGGKFQCSWRIGHASKPYGTISLFELGSKTSPLPSTSDSEISGTPVKRDKKLDNFLLLNI